MMLFVTLRLKQTAWPNSMAKASNSPFAVWKWNKPMNNRQQPYSPEIQAKYCKPQEDINLGERYCEICGCVLNFDEEDICDDCFFESSRPLTDEEIKQLEEQSEGGSNVV